MSNESETIEIIENRVVILAPGNVEDRSWEQLCDYATGGVMVLVRSTLGDMTRPDEGLIDSANKLLSSTNCLRRGRVSVAALLDMRSACDFSAREMRERAERRVGDAAELSQYWQDLGGTTPRHPVFSKIVRAGRDALDCCKLAKRYKYAANILGKMAGCAFPDS